MSRMALLGTVFVLTTLACSMNVNIDTEGAAPTPERSIEVAAGKPTTSSSYYYYDPVENFPPSGVVDGDIQELNCVIGVSQAKSYWLLADKSTGWVQVDLLQEYQIVEVQWLNTHNGTCMDRGTTKFHISISNSGEFSREEETIYSGEMEINSAPQFKEIILSQPKSARYIRFYVDDYYKNGGGLNELRVYATTASP